MSPETKKELKARSEITIRQLEWQDTDIEQILEIDALCFNSYDAYTLEDYRRRFKANPDLCLVAEIGGRIAGDMLSSVIEGKAELNSMATHPDYRRCGVGAALLDETVRLVRAYDMRFIELQVRKSNSDGLAFWQKMGFVIIEELPGFYPDGEDGWLMSKSIS